MQMTTVPGYSVSSFRLLPAGRERRGACAGPRLRRAGGLIVASLLCHLLVLLAAGEARANDATVEAGYLDVTTVGADPTGAEDSTEAIAQAIARAQEEELVVFFPPGTYRVSDTVDGVFRGDKDKATRLVGSTRDPQQRAVIYLEPDAAGFGDPASPKVVVHLRRADERNADHYEQSIMGIDIRVGAGNHGAVGLRNQGAENTHIQDVTIDLSESGYVGLWGVPGSGGATHRVRVIGGRIGVSTYDAKVLSGVESERSLNSQPTPVLTGITLENQSDYAILVNSRGPQVMVGCRIVTQKHGPVIQIAETWKGDPLSGQLNLIDSTIEYASHDERNTVIEMQDAGGSFLMENCYLRHADSIFVPDLAANDLGWTHVRRLGYPHIGYGEGELRFGLVETCYVDGERVEGDVYYDAGDRSEPPSDLQSRHLWDASFPSFESEGAVNVKAEFGAKGDGETDDLAALQAAVDAAEVVFLPKGQYALSDTLKLKPHTKLVGVFSSLTQIVTIDEHGRRFGGADGPTEEGVPLIQMPDVPDGDVVLFGLNIGASWPLAPQDPTELESYAIDWRCNAVLREVNIHPHKQIYYHPRKVIEEYYGQGEDYPHDGPYPHRMEHDVLPRKWPLVRMRGHAEGAWYTFWLHGDHYQKPEARLIKIEGTTRPISIYHFHCQHNQGEYYLEAIDASHVSVYGSKSEGTYAIARFADSDHIRWFGHGGIGSPAPGNPLGVDWFFRFDNVPNFVFGGFAPQLLGSGGHFRSHQAPYHRWWKGAHGEAHALVDVKDGGWSVEPDMLHAPLLYVRGNPAPQADANP